MSVEAISTPQTNTGTTSFAPYVWPAIVLLIAYAAVPLVANSYFLEALLLPFLALSLAGVGLNLLAGYAGQVSLGSAAFLAIGAFAAFNLNLRVPGLPILVNILISGVIGAFVGIVFGLPSLRLKGFYLAVSTLATQFFTQWALTNFGWFSNYNSSGVIDAPKLSVLGFEFVTPVARYYFTLSVVVLLTLFAWRVATSQTGRNFIAVRDNEVAARVIGIPVLKTKMIAFGLSSFLIGAAGVLWAFAYLRTVEPAGFNLDRSFQILFIVIIGGLATIRGAFLGAALIVTAPVILSRIGSFFLGDLFDSGVLEMSQRVLLGVLIIAFLILEPDGLAALTARIWKAFRTRLGVAGSN